MWHHMRMSMPACIFEMNNNLTTVHACRIVYDSHANASKTDNKQNERRIKESESYKIAWENHLE